MMNKGSADKHESSAFEKLTKALVSVPKAEADKAEKARKLKTRKSA